MKSNIPASTTLAQLVQMLNNGTFPYDIGPLNPAGISQQGTPLNKATLFSDQTMAKYPSGIEDPDGAFEKLAEATLVQTKEKYTEHTETIGGLSVGTTIALNVDGEPWEFIVVNQGIPSSSSSLYDSSCDGTWLLMKDCYESRQWHSSDSNSYKASTIHSYLNGTFLNLFDADIREVIKQVKIPYVNGTGNSAVASGSSGLSCKIFLLSGREVGFSTSDDQYFPNDGTKLSYFDAGTGTTAKNKRIAKLNRSTINWWLRSPYTSGPFNAWFVDANGGYNYGNCSNLCGIRPALVLPSDYSYTYYTDEDGNVYTEQEYAQSFTDILGNTLMDLPGTKIYTGSYTGTGVEGQSNPTSIVLPKKPDIVIIGTCDQYNHLYFSLFPVGYFPNNIDVEGGYTLFNRGATLGGGNTTIIRSCYAKFNDSTKELTWSYRYSSIGSNGSNQLNGRNTTYVWHAICFP